MPLRFDFRKLQLVACASALSVVSGWPAISIAQAPTGSTPMNNSQVLQTDNSSGNNDVRRPDQGTQGQNISAQYAESALKLAELTLRQAVEANQQFPGTYSAVTIRCLQGQVTIAQSRLQVAQNGGDGGLQRILLSEIDGNLKTAEAKFHNASAGGKLRTPQSTDGQLLQLAVEVDRLAVERVKSPNASLAELPHR